jgi:hypothetical protein
VGGHAARGVGAAVKLEEMPAEGLVGEVKAGGVDRRPS